MKHAHTRPSVTGTRDDDAARRASIRAALRRTGGRAPAGDAFGRFLVAAGIVTDAADVAALVEAALTEPDADGLPFAERIGACWVATAQMTDDEFGDVVATRAARLTADLATLKLFHATRIARFGVPAVPRVVRAPAIRA
jgi:hypothetical protein